MEQSHVVMGEHWRWGGDTPFGLSLPDREYHLYMTGRSGMGKTTLMQEILRQDIEAGRGCGIIDPHGDVAERVLSYVPSHRIDDVVYVDPTLSKYRVVINPFYRPPEDENARAVLGYNILSTFKHLWHDAWTTTRLPYILTNMILALLDAPDYLRPSLLGIPLMCVDKKYRDAVIRSVKNAGVRQFFTKELETYGKNYMVEAFGPIQNRIGQFLTHPAMRHTFGSWKPTLNFQDIIDSGKILIVRIPRGIFGEEPTSYFGSFTMTGLQTAAMGRVLIPEADRRPFFLNVDEFQIFGTDATAQIFSEARKFKLFLTVAHQYLGQLDSGVLDAVFGNVGSYVSFRMQGEDAKQLAAGIDGFRAEELNDLGRGEVVAQLLQDGIPQAPITGRTYPPTAASHGHERNIKRQCRHRYYRRTDVVEREVLGWLEQFAPE